MSLYQNDQVIAKLTRIIMKDGKKHCALQILDDCFALLRSKYSVEDPASFTRACVQIAKPVVETRKYVIGGRTIGVPTPCRPQRQESLALRFIRYVSLPTHFVRYQLNKIKITTIHHHHHQSTKQHKGLFVLLRSSSGLKILCWVLKE